jgi:putative ABC transport system permease protein
LAAVGVYGVVAFAVSRRTREIGLRMAMGATQGEILRQILREGVGLALPGLVLGCLLTAAAAALMRSEFFGLSPVDPLAFGGAAGLLFLVIVMASVTPARRASSIDPMKALRME